MPDLLLELLSEEIPARMQARASEDLKRLVTDGLVNAGLTYEGAQSFATPRRLTLNIVGLPARSPDLVEEKKGPRVGAPEQALAGFLKGAGLASISEATVIEDKKGDFYVARISKPGRAATEVIAELIPGIIRSFPWPKSQRWGSGALRWVRPLQSILCTFGPETEEPEVVRFEVEGIVSGNTTRGHRFHAPETFAVKRFEDYVAKLEKARVVLDPARRRDIILHDARDLALAQGLELIEDEGLLDEVAGLVEWPVALMGSFEEEFLTVPGEVIRATIRANQKCFVLKDPKTGKLANRFILTANIAASDGGAAVVAGNGRVIRARLSDARHFYMTDLGDLADYAGEGKPLDQRLAKLKALNVIFHEKLGTQFERVERIKRLAREIAPLVGANADLAERAAHLAKADLMTEVVGEFPEVQGLMGRYYAEAQGEHPSVARAIEDHYKPQGPSDRVPTDPVAIAVALADKLDTLVGFWAIDEKPTGSKDPYQLRRAALGVIRIVLENSVKNFDIYEIALFHRASENEKKYNIRLEEALVKANYDEQLVRSHLIERAILEKTEGYLHIGALTSGDDGGVSIQKLSAEDSERIERAYLDKWGQMEGQANKMDAADLLAFFYDRLKVQLRESGVRHDLVDAVLALGANVDLVSVVERIKALSAFITSDDGRNLLAGYNRAANILKAEEKKTGESYAGAIAAALLVLPEEQALAGAVATAKDRAAAAVAAEDFAAAMAALATLRAPVDAFFDKVLVNDPVPEIRVNRLNLLAEIRAACQTVADFGKIQG